MEIKIKNRGAASDPAWCRECELDKTEEKEDIERLDECLHMYVQHHPPPCLFSHVVTIGHFRKETKMIS